MDLEYNILLNKLNAKSLNTNERQIITEKIYNHIQNYGFVDEE